MNELTYENERTKSFNEISKNIDSRVVFKSQTSLLAKGDSLEILKQIPDNSISLILTDPPYHSTKKKNIVNDTAFESDEEFLNWISDYSKEWFRVLKPNGSIFLFCSSKMSAKIELLLAKKFNILSHVVWTKPNDPGFDGWKQKMNKESLRQWYAHSERIIFAEPASEGNIFRVWYGNFIREQRIKCGLTMKDLTELTGDYGKVNHGGAVSNWEAGRNVPSREQYEKISTALISTGKIHSMPFYEDLIRVFDVNSDLEFTDVWNFNSVRPYKGKHPAEKPIEMLEHCIKSTTYEGDIVLDCFGGSGSMAIAAMNQNRKSITIEIEDKWVEMIEVRLKNHKPNVLLPINGNKKHAIMKINGKKINSSQKLLFS
ncbi:MAG: site-specific DNA-methyltransferase [Saprospiraceae bacterium]